MEPTRYKKLQILRKSLVNKRSLRTFSEDDLLDLVEQYETDADFKAFCEADDVLREPMGNWAAWWFGSAKHMRDYFYQFRDFCYGRRNQPPETQDWILSFYQIEPASFRQRCDADPVVRGVIEGWLRERFIQLREFCAGIRQEPPEWLWNILHLYQFTGPVFRKSCDADPLVLEELERWVGDLFDQLRDFCYGASKSPPGTSLILLALYRSEGAAFKRADFRERCDADPVMREVIEQWLREEAEVLKNSNVVTIFSS